MEPLRTGALISLAALGLACGPREPASSAAGPRPSVPDDTGTIVISQPSDALTLDPYDENESPTFAILCNLFDPLVDTDPNLQLRPCLAESWTIVDEETWDFHLRRGVVFHSGDPFTADDVVFSIHRAINWEGSEISGDVATFASAEALDDFTVRITTRGPDPILLNRLTAVLIMDKESTEQAVAEHGEGWMVDHPNGTGPYRFAEWRREEYIALDAFADSWRGEPDIQHVRFRPRGTDQTRMAALLTGESHLVTDVPVRDIEHIVDNPTFQLIQRPSLRLIYLGVDCGRDQSPGLPDSPPNPFRDRRVREAVYLAINEQAIVDRVMNGFAVPAGQLVPDTIFGYDPTITRPECNPQRARELLAEAGFPDGFRVVLDAPNNRYVNDERIAQAIAGQLARVGIIVEVHARPKTVFFEDEEQERSSFFLIGWSNSNGDSSGTFEYLLHTNDPEKSLGSSNHSSQYSNPELDALTEQAQRTVDRDERLEILRQCMRVAMQDLPHIPLHYQVDLFGALSGLEWVPRADTRLQAIDMHWRTEAP